MRIKLDKTPIKKFQKENGFVLYNPLNHEIVFNKSNLQPADDIFLDSITLERPKLKKARVELTLGCNAACKYCVVFKNDVSNIGKTMNHGTARNIAAFFNENMMGGTLMLIGGEPLDAWDITKYLFESCEAGEKVLFTNGTLVTKEYAKFLSDQKVLVLVSLDGMHQHNTQRVYSDGREIFGDTIRGLRTLQDANSKIAISAVVTNHNVYDLADIVEFYHKELSVDSVGLTTPHHINNFDFALDIKEYTNQMLNIFSYSQENNIYIDQIAKRIKAIAHQDFKDRACKISGDQITFYPDGTTSLCIKIDKIPKLKDKKADYYFEKLPIFDSSCVECTAIGVCGGGCYLDAFYDPTGRDQRDCYFYPKLVEHIIWDMKDLVDEKGKISKEKRILKYKGMLHE
ncbi:hypothetical protein CEE44_04105 [Candidatus Woesearchaeota archaeon B3_Woes]|nr:MAG: hypothetical protein CEE44_04105 [Candidatus Woesearchaeota archaeon B3_Woes]